MQQSVTNSGFAECVNLKQPTEQQLIVDQTVDINLHLGKAILPLPASCPRIADLSTDALFQADRLINCLGFLFGPLSELLAKV